MIAAGESDGQPEATRDHDSHRWGVILAGGDGSAPMWIWLLFRRNGIPSV